MEGTLSIPPERNLLSRGNWKQRYVVLGPRKLLGNTSSPRKMLPTEPVDDDFSGVDDVFENRGDYEFMQRFSTDPRLSIFRSRTDSEPLVSYPLECVTSCYVGDIAHRKAFSSMSKTTYSALCPTLVVNLQLESSTWTGKRRGSDSPTASTVPQYYEPDDGKVTLFFRSGPNDVPPLTIWCREIQSYIRATQSRRSSTITFGGDKSRRQSFRSVAYDLKIAEDEWEEERVHHQIIMTTQRSSEESMESSSEAGGTSRPISRLNMHDFGNQHRGSVSATQSPVDPDSLGPDYLACASLSSSPRRETILDRAFSMNYIPSSGPPIHYTTPPITSVARFEAVANDPGVRRDHQYKELEIDPSVMPASFFKYTH